MKIQNPILRGFNPDPSIIRVGEDYYIATSTFEWFPGVQIHHSRDLIHWRLMGRVLNRTSQLNLLGVPDSCGVWAPCLSFDRGVFYLVFSNVKSFDGTWKDTPNYLVTTTDINGDWSDPIFLGSSGFDGSLFHNDDGRKWYLSMLVDHRKGKFFGGILLQEYDPEAKRLIGKPFHIFEGTNLGLTEGPHLYKKDGYYYLVLAEGGTEYQHAFSMARSKNIEGPYEVHPENPVITSSDDPSLTLQKAGHGDFVQTQNGEWYAVFLVGRPLTERGRCITGRETAIEKITWRSGQWPVLARGGHNPGETVEGPGLEPHAWRAEMDLDDFDTRNLNIHFQSLRLPMSEDWLTLTERPGYLRLKGRESLSSLHYQSLVARRVQHRHVEASTCVEFEPTYFQHMAGLVCYYNCYHYHYLYITSDDSGARKLLNIVSCDRYRITEALSEMTDVTGVARVYLKADYDGADLQFYFGREEDQWEPIGPMLDGSILSDDYVQDIDNRYRPAFTGAFVGLACQDLTGHKRSADFDWFRYKEIF